MEGPSALQLEQSIDAANMTVERAIRYGQLGAFGDHLTQRLRLLTEIISAADIDFLGNDAAFMQSALMASLAQLGLTVIEGYLTDSVNIQHVRRET